MKAFTAIRIFGPCFFWFLLLPPLFTILGCGSDFDGSNAESLASLKKGSLSYQVIFTPFALDSEQSIVSSPSGNVCQDYLITQIVATVSDIQDGSVITSETWDCNIPDRRKTIGGIRPTNNLRVLLEGYVEGEDQPRWRGEKLNIIIQSGKNTDAGQIFLRNVGSDKEPPFIVSTTPVNESMEVPLSSAITVTFTEDVVPHSLLDTLTLQKVDDENATVAVLFNPDVNYNPQTYTATFRLESDLEELTEFRATIESNDVHKIQDRSGNEMKLGFTWSFFSAPRPTIWHVDGSVTNSGNGKSWDQAFKTIQEAIVQANESKHDEVWVKSYPYELSSPILVNKGIGIYGGFLGDEKNKSNRRTRSHSIIQPKISTDGSNRLEHLLIILQPNITIDYFYFYFGGKDGIEGENLHGGAIYGDLNIFFHRNIAITNCEFGNNFGNSGGAIYFNGVDSLVINKCIFEYNHAIINEGGSVYIENGNNIEITNCNFQFNDANNQGGAISFKFCDRTILTNCVFHYNSIMNTGGKGGAIYWYYSSPKVVNCTFFNNQNLRYADIEAAGYSIFGHIGSPNIFNSIFFNNLDARVGPEVILESSEANVSFCLVKGGYEYGGSNNLEENVNPDFENISNSEYQLQVTSPCIDAGSNDAYPLSESVPDLKGNNRIIETIDMGAYEYQH